METSWTTFKKNINFSEYEENMKEEKKPRNSRWKKSLNNENKN